ncbi:Ribosomal RNA large subunit methyltransferase F [Madurella mycetomatis]|uniref:Ribosomal RNA large subunit methyltransferase F n=1 Tax=Madurella mycetomatis TaxID=100816 RepID=A0A175W4W2_9PEZI|nr:Ribosomal RNA large subunit methyltransferase F [Madurella mycetomatis]
MHVATCTTWFRCLFKMVQKIGQDSSEDGPEYAGANRGHKWFEMTVFSRWDSRGKCQMLCVDAPFDFPHELRNRLARRTAPLDFKDPFAMYSDVWDLITHYYDIAIWRPRRLWRGVFTPINEYMRHSIHLSEILQSALGTAQEIQLCRAKTYQSLDVANGVSETYKQQGHDYAAFQISLLRNLHLRCTSNQARLANETTITFNNITLQDSNFVKSITFLTMIFLPATFVSAVFSTTFYNFGNKELEVSDQVWIYWSIIIPVTVAVVALWRTVLKSQKRF